MTSLNTSYSINDHFEVVFNYLYKGVRRTGADDFTPYHTVPFTEPQSLQTSFTGLSLNSNFFERRLRTEVFVKHYGYNASVTEENFTTDETDQDIIEIGNKQSNLGGGIAGSLKIRLKTLLKASLERAIRLPDTREALGNGVNILNSPHIRPEKSFNLNFGASFGKYFIGDRHAFKLNVNGFYRDTEDLIYPTISGGRGEITYMNISKILGKGAELELIYDFDSKIEFTYNITYLDQRNNEEVNEHGIKNMVYRDRLRNAPYLMSNAELNFKLENLIQKSSKSFIYSRAGYVHEYYLNWPSLGSGDNKLTVPTQLVVDAGFSYTFPSNSVSLAFDATNIFNTQVYDNFLLQKPGRSFAVKVSYRISEI